MKGIRNAFFTRPLSLYLALALIAATAFAGPAEAMYLDLGGRPAQGAPSVDRTTDLARIQKTLESQVIRQRLEDYGLSPDEALAKLGALTDGQVHQLASRIDAVQAGGRGSIDTNTLIIILLLVVLILLLVQNTEGQQGRPA